MKDNKLLNIAQEFAVEIIVIANELRNKKEYSISDQIKRSGTEPRANAVAPLLKRIISVQL